MDKKKIIFFAFIMSMLILNLNLVLGITVNITYPENILYSYFPSELNVSFTEENISNCKYATDYYDKPLYEYVTLNAEDNGIDSQASNLLAQWIEVGIMGVNQSFNLSQIEVALRRDGYPEDVVVYLVGTNPVTHKPNGTILSVSTNYFNGSTLYPINNYTYVNFTMTPYELKAGKDYQVIATSPNGNLYNRLFWRRHSWYTNGGEAYNGFGNSWISTNNGTTWDFFDFYFATKIYGSYGELLTYTNTPCQNITGLTSLEGSNFWSFWANDTEGNEDNDIVNFEVDTTPPIITILYPENITYNDTVNKIIYNYTSEDCESVWYSNNEGITNSSIFNCGENLTGINSTNGINQWDVWANDTLGNTNKTSILFYTDINYPTFSNYLDDNSLFYGNRTGSFSVNVQNTNGTVYLYINGTSVTAINLTANTYSASYYLDVIGDYEYYWYSYGNGTLNNFAVSNNNTITVKQPINSTISFIDAITPTNFLNLSENNFTVYVNVTTFNHTMYEIGNIMKVTIWNSTFSTQYINQIEPLLVWDNSTGDKQFHNYDYLTTGLKAGYNFDELSGGTLKDKGNKGYNGTIGGSIIKGEAGILNYSYNFSNPTMDYVWIDTGVYPDETDSYGNYSYSVWIYWTGGGGYTSQWIIADDYLNLYIGQDMNGTLSFNKGGGDINSNQSIPKEVWTNVIISCNQQGGLNSGNVTMYINGTVSNSVIYGNCVIPYGRDIYIGRYKYSNTFNWGGLIDELYFWNKSINRTEAMDIYNNGTGITLSRELGRRYPFAISSNQTFILNSGVLGDGNYYYNSSFTDAINNTIYTETRTITLDMTNPSVAYINPPTPNFTFVNESFMNFTFNLSDNLGLDNVTFTLLNRTNSTISQTTTLLYGVIQAVVSFPFELADGIFGWVLSIRDRANNERRVNANYTLDVYTVTPTINFILSTPTDSSVITTNNFTIYTNVSIQNHTINEVGTELKTVIWGDNFYFQNSSNTYAVWKWFYPNGTDKRVDYLSRDLRAYYKLEETANPVRDNYLSIFNGTFSNTAKMHFTGKINYCYQFPSTMYLPNVFEAENETGTSYSWSIWMYPDDNLGGSYTNQTFMYFGNRVVIWRIQGKNILYTNSTGAYINTAPYPYLNWYGWHLLTYTYDKSTNNGSFYVDGVIKSSFPEPADGGIFDTNVTLGTSSYGGYMDEIAFWNRTLNGSEIGILYANNIGITPASFNPQPFADDFNQTFSVNSGLLANGTYYFNATFEDGFGTIVSTETREIDISDIVPPNITGSVPLNDTYSVNKTVNFTANVSDIFGIDNATLTINNETGLYNQTTVNLGGIMNTVIGIPVYLIEGIYSWFYNIWDRTGNLATTEERTYTIDTTTPSYVYNESAGGNLYNGINISQSNIPLNISISETNLANITYILYNDTGTTIVNQTTTNATYFNWVSVPDGHYWYKTIITDKANNQNETPLTSATLDTVPVNITQTLFGTGTEFYVFDTNTLTFNFTVNDTTSGILNTSIKIYDRLTDTYANITTYSGGNIYSKAISVPITLPDGKYTWKVDAYDYANNYEDPDENITIDTEYPQLSILSPVNNTGYNATSFTVVANGSDLTEQYIMFRLFNSSGQGTSTHNTSSPYKINAVFSYYSDGMVSTIQNVNDSNQITYGNATVYDGNVFIDVKFRNVTFDLGDGEINGDAIIYYNFTTFNTTGNGQLYTSWNHCYQWNDSGILYGLSGLVPPALHYTGNYFQKAIIPASCINPVTNEVRFRIEWFSGYGTYGRLYEIWINYNITQPLQQYTYTDGTRSQLFSGLPYEGNYYFDVSMRDIDNRVNTTALYKVYLDFTEPTGESGGYSGSGTSPVNRTYTNQSAINFTVNASDVGGIGNVTLTILNESNDIINTTIVTFPEKPTNLFFGIIYYLWYEGFYRWYYTIMDAVGFSATTEEAVITYDITNPNSIINYPINTTYNHIVTHLDYTYDEENCNDTWLVAGSTYSDGCGSTYTGLASVEQNNTWTLYMRDKAGNVNSSFISFTQDTIPPTVIFTNRTEPNNTFFGNYRTWIFVEVNYSEPIDLYNLTYRLSKVGTGTINTTTYTIPTLPKTINWTGLTDGVYTYYAEVCDLYANCNRTDTRTLYLDNIPPVITFPAGQIVNVSATEFPINISFQYNITDNNHQLKQCWYKIDNDRTNGTTSTFSLPSFVSNETGTILGTTRNETSRWLMYEGNNATHQRVYQYDIETETLISIINLYRTYQYYEHLGSINYWNNKLIIAGGNGYGDFGYYPVSVYYTNGTFIAGLLSYGIPYSWGGDMGEDGLYYDHEGQYTSMNYNYFRVWNITANLEHSLGNCSGESRYYFMINNSHTFIGFFFYNGYLWASNGTVSVAYDYNNISCQGNDFIAPAVPQFTMPPFENKISVYRSGEYDLNNFEGVAINGYYIHPTPQLIDANYLLYQKGYYDFIECNSNTTAPVFQEGMQLVAVYGMDNASNTNYSILEYYVLYHEYEQNSSVGDTTVEGEIITYTLNVTMTDLTPTSAQFIYNGVSYPADSFSVAGNQYQFTIDFTIPDGAGNTTGKLAQWYWNYSITNYFEGYETEPQNQTVYSVEIDNCTLYDEVVLNLYQLNDEETDTLMNETLNPKIEVDVKLISQGNPDIFWQYSTLFNSMNGSICIPSVILNYTDYYLDIVIGFSADTYVNEFWYLDKGNVSQDSFWFDDYTSRNVTLRDLLADDSTSFLFTFYDENYLTQPNAIVTVLRKYINEGVFKEVERSKQDDNGQTLMHLVQEDVIYKFRVTLDGELLYESGEYTAKCVETPCSITLQKGTETVEIPDESERDNLPAGTYSISVDRSNRTATLSFNLNETGDMSFAIYTTGNNPNQYTLIDSDTVTSKSGTLTVYVPQTYDNQTFLASVRHNDMYVVDEWIDFTRSAYDIFGAMGLFLGAILVLTLGLIAVSHGGWTIVFIILGLIISMIAHLIDLDFYTLMWIICTGGLIVWKLSTRRTI